MSRPSAQTAPAAVPVDVVVETPQSLLEQRWSGDRPLRLAELERWQPRPAGHPSSSVSTASAVTIPQMGGPLGASFTEERAGFQSSVSESAGFKSSISDTADFQASITKPPVMDFHAAKPLQESRPVAPVMDFHAAKPSHDSRPVAPVMDFQAAKPLHESRPVAPVMGSQAARPLHESHPVAQDWDRGAAPCRPQHERPVLFAAPAPRSTAPASEQFGHGRAVLREPRELRDPRDPRELPRGLPAPPVSSAFGSSHSSQVSREPQGTGVAVGSSFGAHFAGASLDRGRGMTPTGRGMTPTSAAKLAREKYAEALAAKAAAPYRFETPATSGGQYRAVRVRLGKLDFVGAGSGFGGALGLFDTTVFRILLQFGGQRPAALLANDGLMVKPRWFDNGPSTQPQRMKFGRAVSEDGLYTARFTCNFDEAIDLPWPAQPVPGQPHPPGQLSADVWIEKRTVLEKLDSVLDKIGLGTNLPEYDRSWVGRAVASLPYEGSDSMPYPWPVEGDGAVDGVLPKTLSIGVEWVAEDPDPD